MKKKTIISVLLAILTMNGWAQQKSGLDLCSHQWRHVQTIRKAYDILLKKRRTTNDHKRIFLR